MSQDDESTRVDHLYPHPVGIGRRRPVGLLSIVLYTVMLDLERKKKKKKSILLILEAFALNLWPKQT